MIEQLCGRLSSQHHASVQLENPSVAHFAQTRFNLQARRVDRLQNIVWAKRPVAEILFRSRDKPWLGKRSHNAKLRLVSTTTGITPKETMQSIDGGGNRWHKRDDQR
jgi:hypothetical protein